MAYLEQTEDARWRLRAGTFGDLQVEYVERGPEWPRDIRMTSLSTATGPPVSITISELDMLDTNGVPDASVFQSVIAEGAIEMSLDDLRRTLGGSGNEDD